ncbi:MAG: RnfABCDGE type electron transport complex subunit B, partial [Oscillospiraceae bacterium]|nr:RnfABCDGE type electron transport complex subunit B [Oscillospiraceae bacterium]
GVDERETAVRECLPGNNCGACGYAGCDAVAAAIVKGEAKVNACPVCSDDAAAQIGSIMGVAAEAGARQAAFVRCAGDCGRTAVKCNYVGISDCRAAALAGISIWNCDYGCLGFGSCADVCEFDALHIVDGLAVVDRTKCRACGLCVTACPKGLIELAPVERKAAVSCSSRDKGAAVKKACTVGCIGCMLCVKQCEAGAITVENNLAHVDYSKCTGCGKCAEKCPVKAITLL